MTEAKSPPTHDHGRGFAGNRTIHRRRRLLDDCRRWNNIARFDRDNVAFPLNWGVVARYRPAHHDAARRRRSERGSFHPFQTVSFGFCRVAAFRQRFGKIGEQYGEP
ncbi:hypothetical protein KCP73_03855 [Salmonella enterica subsp. enterica]|nr:hypothetical protein KCP73_03855 [Salmonella enterica subsp. enterica]